MVGCRERFHRGHAYKVVGAKSVGGLHRTLKVTFDECNGCERGISTKKSPTRTTRPSPKGRALTASGASGRSSGAQPIIGGFSAKMANAPDDVQGEGGKWVSDMRNIYELTTEEAYQLVAEHFGHELPPLQAVENEDWGRDYVLQHFQQHSKEELALAGLTWEAPRDD